MVEPIPAEVASAISAVMAGVRTLGKDDRNNFAKYDFVSTDKFLAAVNPLCAAAGLVIIQDEESVSIASTEMEDDYGKAKKKTFLTARYSFVLAHKSGATWGPVYRTVMVSANGAQAFGSAQSYAQKQFMRSLFQISTGDKDDADLRADEPLPGKNQVSQQRTPANSQTSIADRPAKEAAAATLISSVELSEDMDELVAWWKEHQSRINALPDDLKATVTAAKDKRKAELQEIPQAAE